ncbi:MAG: hypothetical protein GY741_16770 [Phycisphaeraceae bacterium]|nr:hypothetical protein [Phycisphaeraceae bacterium]
MADSAAFTVEVLLTAGFLAGDFLPGDFLAGDFLEEDFLSPDDFADVVLAATTSFNVVFFAAGFLVVLFFGVGALVFVVPEAVSAVLAPSSADVRSAGVVLPEGCFPEGSPPPRRVFFVAIPRV